MNNNNNPEAYWTGEPIKEKRSATRVVITGLVVVIFLLAVVHLIMAMTIVFPKNKLFLPGYHTVKMYPYVIRVESGQCATLKERSFWYDVTYLKAVMIPVGYVGVVVGEGKSPHIDTLEAGKYYIDTTLYTVTMIDTRSQTWIYGDKKSE